MSVVDKVARGQISAAKVDTASLFDSKADKLQEDWITPTLINGWVGTNGIPQYFRDQLGIIHFRGALSPTNKTSPVAFALPIGYRPSGDLYINFSGSDYFQISSAGAVSAEVSTWASLATITFRAEG